MKLLHFVELMDKRMDQMPFMLGGESSSPYLRKYFVYGQLGLFVLMIVLYMISWGLSVEMYMQFCLVSLVYGLVMMGILILSGWREWLILTTKMGMELIVFYYVSRMGGLLTSGGLILSGLAPVFYSLIFRKYKWMMFIFASFVLSLVLLFLFDRQFSGKDLLTQQQNLLLGLIVVIGIVIYIFIFALYTQKIFINLEKKEARHQKEISDAKTRLFVNITHEFRTPLTVMLGLADTLKGERSRSISTKADTILKNGKQLLQLVDQLMELSKLESGNLKVNAVHGDIVPFLRYTFQLYEYYALEKNFHFTFQSQNPVYELDFDPEKITSIVSNLLGNAIKFTPPGGNIKMDVKVEDTFLVMAIADDGIGIPEEKQGKIFDRFYQVDDRDTRKEGGAGIGLALTYELVMLMKGSINFTSEPHVKTVFTVKLPVEHRQERATGSLSFEETPDFPVTNGTLLQTELVKPEAKPTVLFIEDNLDLVSYLESSYQNRFSIAVALNGGEGFQKAMEAVPDIIVSDVMMPGMDGFTLCKKLKDDYRTSHIPIILLTARADVSSRIKGLELGADAYMVKPFHQKELLVRMNMLMEMRRKLQLRYANIDLVKVSDDPRLKHEDFFFQKVTGLIKENLQNENYDIPTLCEDMAMSKSQLYRKFKALTNMSAAKYIRKLRLQKARNLLLSSSMNVTEVSFEVGMKTLSTFSELFKEEFGQSPTEYINQHKTKFHNN